MESEKTELFRESDLRVRKTQKALSDAIFSLLNRRNFNNITVHDLCSEALVSRATFYSHFRDKYGLLDCLLSEVRASVVKDVRKYAELEQEVNQFIDSNKKLISNILQGANDETLSIVRRFMSSIVGLTIKRTVKDDTSPQHITLFNFAIGGLLNQLLWIAENDYPPEVPMINAYLYKMLETMTVWDAKQEKTETTP